MTDLWILISAMLVLLLVAGMGVHASGAVRAKNSVSMLFQTFVCFPVVFLFWIFIGHKLAFTHEPNKLLVFFHASFALTATVIPFAAWSERLEIKAYFAQIILWPLLVYVPVAQWIWFKEGWLAQWGVTDFAGGIVVHVSAGFSALAGSIILGRRKDYFNLRKPHSITSIYLGIVMIFLGWLGFNGGSALSFNDIAETAILNTVVAASAGTMIWIVLEALHPPHRINLLETSYGMICSLVAVTAGAGVLSLPQALAVSCITVVICFYCVRVMNRIFKVDDSLNVFSSHGVAGILGSWLTGFFLHKAGVNLSAAAIVGGYSFVVSFLLFKIFKGTIGLRVSEGVESQGLDIVYHGEKITNLEAN